MTPDREMDEERFLEKWMPQEIGMSEELIPALRKDLSAIRKSWERKAEANGMRAAARIADNNGSLGMATKIRKLADAIEGGAE